MDCTVCLGPFDEAVVLPCGHSFCKGCVERLVTSGPSRSGLFHDRVSQCPECRQPFVHANLQSNVSLNRVVERRQSELSLLDGSSCSDSEADGHGAGRTRLTKRIKRRSSLAIPQSLFATAGRTGSSGHNDDIGHVIHALKGFGATPAFARHIALTERNTGLRIYVLDNSGSTAAMDGKTYTFDAHSNTVTKCSCTRWEETKEFAMQHARWNVALRVPTEFHLLNPKLVNDPRELIDYIRVDPWASTSPSTADDLVEQLRLMLEGTKPGKGTPLAERLWEIEGRLEAQKEELLEHKQVFLVLVTDGVPTPVMWSSHGKESDMLEASHRLVIVIKSILSKFPVALCVRLATDDEHIVRFWNELDEEEEFALDVLDDIAGEAKEIRRVGNDFFAYGPVLQMFREAGNTQRIYDVLDEKAVSIKQATYLVACLIGIPCPFASCPSATQKQKDNQEVERYLSTVEREIQQEQFLSWNAGTLRREPIVNTSRLRALLLPSNLATGPWQPLAALLALLCALAAAWLYR